MKDNLLQCMKCGKEAHAYSYGVDMLGHPWSIVQCENGHKQGTKSEGTVSSRYWGTKSKH